MYKALLSEHSIDNIQSLTKTNNDNKSVSNRSLKELMTNTWFKSWGPIDHAPKAITSKHLTA